MYVCLSVCLFLSVLFFSVLHYFLKNMIFFCLFMSKMLRFRFSSLLAVTGCNLNSYFTWSTEFGAFFNTRENM